MASFVHLFLVCIWILPVTCYAQKWQCHNYNRSKEELCYNVIYNISAVKSVKCEVCKHYNQYNFDITICDTTEFKITISDILDAVPQNITHLVIYYDNKWNGYLPLKPDPIVLDALGRLTNLKYFQITDANYKYYQLYPIIISEAALKNLTQLTSLVIRIPIIDNEHLRLGDIVNRLPSLELIDLSYTRGVGTDSLKYLLQNINPLVIKHICLRKYQLIGGIGYSSNFADVLNGINFTFPNLIELDVSDNTLAKMPPGISNLAPKLQKFDISGNMLLDTSNMALLFESFMHPNIIDFSAGFQGFKGRNPDPVIHIDGLHTPRNSAFANQIIQTGERLTNPPNSTEDLQQRQIQFLVYCSNQAGSNVSNTFHDSKISCKFLVCILPSFFKDIDCEKQNFIPTVASVYNWYCMLHINLPIGKSLESFYFSEVHLEQAETVGFKFTGTLCLRPNNKLKTIIADGNKIWMQSAQLSNILTSIEGISGFEHLKFISANNNSVSIANFTQEFTGILPNVEVLDISGNSLNFQAFCSVIPKLKALNLMSTNMTYIPPNLVKDCPYLETLILKYNRINVDSLNSMNLSGTENIKNLDLTGCAIHVLDMPFLKKVEQYNNLTIDLSENPMHCDCNSQEFARWVLKSKSKLRNYHKYYCTGPGGLSFFDTIDPDKYWDKCQSYSLKNIIYSVTITLSITLLVLIIYLIFKIRWRLKYFIFTIEQYCQRIIWSQKGDGIPKLWKYDAFISYCSDDRFWVHETLMQTLEETYGFRLCIHYRDFPVGGDIYETISEEMSHSREIIIVLSDIALRSDWCQFELDEALKQIQARHQHLIVIKLGKIKPYILSPKVASILDNHTFMEWSDNNKHHKLFWATLVGRLYNDPQGNCLCCCPYGTKAIGYQDIVDPLLDNTDNNEDEDEENIKKLSVKSRESWRNARQAQSKANRAKGFRKKLEKVLEDDQLPGWAYGPTPLPIDQLLQCDKPLFEKQVNQHAMERLQLLITCLDNHYQTQSQLYKVNMQQVNSEISEGGHVVNICDFDDDYDDYD